MDWASDSRAWWSEPLFRNPAQPDLFCLAQGCRPAQGGRTGPPAVHIEATAQAIRDLYPRNRSVVICLASAAEIHGLLPHADGPLWVAAPLKAHVPKRDPSVLRTLRWSNRPSFEVGVEQFLYCDVTILCTSRERTIVDLVRYGRHLGGPATAARCLKAYVATGGSLEAIREMADAVRIPHPARLVLDILLPSVSAPS